jgi:hypothetical protein
MNTPMGIYRPRFCLEGVKVGSALMMGVVYSIFSKYMERLILGTDKPSAPWFKTGLND